MNDTENKVMTDEYRDSIAIIGMAGRFPGARNINEFWQNLRNGVESVMEFTAEDLKAAGINPDLHSDPMYVSAGAPLDDAECFDASFFGYQPREAEIMDPQHRVFLECAWAALEDAGYDPEQYDGLIGVFGGIARNTYFLNNLASQPDFLDSVGEYQAMLGSEKDFPATRVAYKLNLKGPAINLQTACSTSGVAVHMACQSLLSGDCHIALAGGGRVLVPTQGGYWYEEGGTLSPDGHCRAFDAKAKGMVRGSGMAFVVLKRLEDALRDHDCIHAIIKGSAINNDGSDKIGFTAPSISGQTAVISDALAVAGVEADSISYVEAHGTGTAIGDPIEIAALTKAFQKTTAKTEFCAVGSVKTNIGHLDAGSAVAGIIKVVLSLKHKLLPPSVNFERPNPQIDFANSPFYVSSKLSKWESVRTPRLAGVSSFGLGGTNVHLILEEAPETETSNDSRSCQLLVLSAKTATALERATENLAKHLKDKPDITLADVAYTLQVGRRRFNHRRAVVCRDQANANQLLGQPKGQRIITEENDACDRDIVLMFTGQGSQYVKMGEGLYHSEPVFRENVDRCSQLLKPQLGFDLCAVLYPDKEKVNWATEQLKQTAITQPALFTIEYALAQLWLSWGVQPRAMIGHSIGEYVAACLGGVFTLEHALALVATRGRLMQDLPSGSMLAVSLSEEELTGFLDSSLSLAAVNGSDLCVASGEHSTIAKLESRLVGGDVSCRPLHTSHAFHSAMMEPILEPFAAAVKQANPHPPKLAFVSNVTGNWITETEATDPNYWTNHLRQTVRFADGLSRCLHDANPVLLEVGPGRTLSTLATQHPDRNADQVVVPSLRHPNETITDTELLFTTLGRLWVAGVNVDWSGFYANEHRNRVSLSTYPFERKRYWVEAKASQDETPTLVNTPVKVEVQDHDSVTELIAQQLRLMAEQLRTVEAYDQIYDGPSKIANAIANQTADVTRNSEHRTAANYAVPNPLVTETSSRSDQCMAVVTLNDEIPVLSRLESQLETELNIRGMDAYPGLEKALDELCSAHVCSYLQSCNIDVTPGQKYQINDLKTKLCVSPKFEKFLDYMLHIIAEDGIATIHNSHVDFCETARSLKNTRELSAALVKKYPEFRGVFEMLQHCSQHYREALAGDMPAISVLYPDGSRDLIDRTLVENTAEYRKLRIYELLTKELLLRLSKKSPLKILEVGAGSGTLTWLVAPFLEGCEVTYHFSDIGRAFVRDAEKEAAKRGLNFMEFGVLDISKDPLSQGYKEQSFNIVLGLNVVHATRDVGETLTQLRKLLIPSGMICLVESVKSSRWHNLVWGLAEGWWYFDDKYRQDSPLLDLLEWKMVLRDQGFADVGLFPFHAEKQLKTDSGLIIGQLGSVLASEMAEQVR